MFQCSSGNLLEGKIHLFMECRFSADGKVRELYDAATELMSQCPDDVSSSQLDIFDTRMDWVRIYTTLKSFSVLINELHAPNKASDWSI